MMKILKSLFWFVAANAYFYLVIWGATGGWRYVGR